MTNQNSRLQLFTIKLNQKKKKEYTSSLLSDSSELLIQKANIQKFLSIKL